ncbi:MAG: hypothetical protein K0R55_3222 [Sporomusa sp.]|nr:hypothetical protein [Sporomusa sp.]
MKTGYLIIIKGKSSIKKLEFFEEIPSEQFIKNMIDETPNAIKAFIINCNEIESAENKQNEII